MQKVNVFWFRRDLRLNDNHGLYQALKDNNAVLPVFIFDKKILSKLSEKKDKRITFIYHTLEKLCKDLIEQGSSLYIAIDEPLQVFEKICKEYTVNAIYANNDYEPYSIERDQEISEFLKAKNILFHTLKDQVIFEKSEVMKSDNSPYTIFTPYSKIWKQKLIKENVKAFPSEKLLNKFIKIKAFKFPSIKEVGFEKVIIDFPSIKIDETIIINYHKTRNIPSVNGTSMQSVHLRFGTVSIRELVMRALKLNEQWLNELIWREFFMMILYHYPYVVTKCFKKKYENILWRNNEKEFESWCKGETGYPIVDAGMRELNETGFMHNRVRMIVASFLTKHLLIDWRWGEAYFAEKSLDFELSSNNGNWQWAAGCGCDAAPYFRVFNPTEQMRKYDSEMLYIKKWIKNYKPDYITKIVEHDFARKRVLEVFRNALTN
ncbi:MAG: deoxyribodipyrimidine photo-lyase [Bacteroidia bacterium]|nr:deoxyribodipyrimidine photo-lyase [Bacteroidia bacterium]